MADDSSGDDYEDDPWLAQYLAGARAKEKRSKSLAWGCMVPLLLVPVLILLAIINPH